MSKTLVFPVASTPVRYFVRVHRTTAVASGSVTLTMSLGPRVYPPVVGSQQVVVEVPFWLPVSVSNVGPGSTVEFTLDSDPTVIGSGRADSAGNLIGYSVLLPATVPAGSHTLKATGGSSTTFTVAQPVAARPPVPPSDAGYVPAVIDRWRLVDPAGILPVLTFPINPSQMSTPHAARLYSSEHTTASADGGGQPITFEGAAVAQAWSVDGSVRTQAFYEALDAYRQAQRRVLVVDHFNRVWIVAVDAIDFTPVREVHNDWSFTYQARFSILGRGN